MPLPQRRLPLGPARRTPRRALRAPAARTLLFLLPALLVLASCGAGGAGGAPATNAPSNIVYSQSPAVYRTDTAITPNTVTADGDPVTSWTIAPPLPGGLSIDPATGAISGTALAPAAATNYTVTATNASGVGNGTVSIEVIWHESKSLLPKANVTDADLRHFLDRTHFGFSQPHYDALNSIGLAAYVDGMTTFADTSQLETNVRNAFLVDPVDDPNGDFPNPTQLAQWHLALMALNTNPFQENLAFHWHEHFACSSQVVRDNAGDDALHFMETHINLFRHEGAGNLRTLLLDMALDSAMLVFLDGYINRDGAVNENFGREWFELFAMGVDIDYTQQDIVEASRAFTGFRVRNDPNTGKDFTVFEAARHDHGEKTVLGVTIPAQTPGDGEVHEYDQVVDITMNHNEAGTGVSRVGQWIVRSLLRYFCYEDPPQNVIDELANDLRASNWELKPVLMKLFVSEAFFSAEARKKIVKGPVEHVLGFIRATNLGGDPLQIDRRLTAMGQRPTQPPGVDGWPGGTQWLSAQGMVDRANLIHYLTVHQEGQQAGNDIFARDLLPTPDADSLATVNAIAERLNIPLSPAEVTTLTTYLDTQRDNSGNVTASPFDPVGDPNEAEDRIRGLLWTLGQHPSYMIR
jgi:uncharacterized protein (DUF1800 family)